MASVWYCASCRAGRTTSITSSLMKEITDQDWLMLIYQLSPPFRYENNNADLMYTQPHHCRVRYVGPCHYSDGLAIGVM